MKDILDVVARILISSFFFYEAADYMIFYQLNLDKMVAYGLTWNTELWLVGATFFLVLSGIMVLIGYRVRLAGLILLSYWLPLTFIVHDWWTLEPGEGRRIQSALFVKNLAILGALMLLMANGSGRFSVRRLLDRRKI
ncbi:MAG: DoxX family membrane protein [Bacteroidetes bacterium]|jgi:putative oxidoreductase|nr:DoxX family membrane protein [Bacteroidota bacterium]